MHPNRKRVILLLGALALAAFLIMTRSLWLPPIGRFLIVADPLQRADAVVPLGGGERERVAQAAALVVDGHADWLVTTDVELDLPGIRDSWAGLVRREAVWQGVPDRQIVDAPGLVTTTCNEALAVAGLARARGWRSVIVVTDPLHTRRARLIFRDVFRDAGVQVIVRGVEGAEYTADSWWRSEEGLRYAWTEYLKLAYALAGCR